MKYTLLIVTTLISFSTYAQKKPVKKSLPIPPPPVRPLNDSEPGDLRNPFPETITFKWRVEPIEPVMLTPTDVLEKSYTFSGRGKNVRISTAYPKNSFSYKKPDSGEVDMAQALTIRYKDYKNVSISGDKVKMLSDDGKEEIRLQLIKKGNKLMEIRELSTNKVFQKTDSYEGEPTISL